MDNKKAGNFVLITIAIIVGGVLFKQFNMETLRFKHNGLAVVYSLCLLFCIYGLRTNNNKQQDN